MKKNFNVILIGIDTLRADHLGAFGYSRGTSPNIDEFAKNSLFFKNCRSQSPHTAPSFMSIMTGKYPTHHGVTVNMLSYGHKIRRAYGLDDSIPTIAKIMQRSGYRTGGFSEGGQLSKYFGFSHGFDYYAPSNIAVEIKRKIGSIPKEEIFYWLKENARDNFFLFFHTYAVHSPWLAPPKYHKIFNPKYSGLLDNIPLPKNIKRNVYQYILDLVLKEGEYHLKHYEAMYDGAIKYVDDFFMTLMNYLMELKIFDKTIIIFTSDHGEEFLEHGKLSHEQLYRENLYVPLIIKAPQYDKPQNIDQLVRSVDIMPTILELLNIEPALTNGVSLLPALEKDLELKAIADSESHGLAIEDKNYKYIYHKNKFLPHRIDELYDIKNDSQEKNNIARENIDLTEEMFHAFENELHKIPFTPPRRKIIYL